MNRPSKSATPLQLQILVWSVIFLTNFLSYLPMDGFVQSIAYTFINTFFYAIIIYGNINFLLPRLYEKKKLTLYILASILFLAFAGIGKALLSQLVYNRFFSMKKQYPLTVSTVIYITIGSIVIFILSFVFRIALAYFTLKQEARQMQEQKSLAELNLLKSQVQPHFLFNTLNNIYYEAFRESPRTALLIGRLSDIMRYFVDESPKEKVALSTEVQFLQNYIALEKIRIRHGVQVSFLQEYKGDFFIPPMLLMTFVENIFKHGVDRSGMDNKVLLSLAEQDGYLLFRTENALQAPDTGLPTAGFGIRNLQRRLNLLYGNNFELITSRTEQSFLAYLKIPIQ